MSWIAINIFSNFRIPFLCNFFCCCKNQNRLCMTEYFLQKRFKPFIIPMTHLDLIANFKAKPICSHFSVVKLQNSWLCNEAVEWLMKNFFFLTKLKVHRNNFQMNRKEAKENFSTCFPFRIFETESIKWFLLISFSSLFVFASFLHYSFSAQNRFSWNTLSWLELEPRAQSPMRKIHRRPNRQIRCVKHSTQTTCLMILEMNSLCKFSTTVRTRHSSSTPIFKTREVKRKKRTDGKWIHEDEIHTIP